MFVSEYLEVSGTNMQNSSHVTAIFLLQSVHEHSTVFLCVSCIFYLTNQLATFSTAILGN